MTWRSRGTSRALWLSAASVVALLGLAGCSSGPTSPRATTGVLTGTAQACAGLVYVPTADVRVYRGDADSATSDVYRRVVPVATEHVRTNTVYRFVLPPGRYFVTNSSTQFAHPFVLSAGSTVQLNGSNWCE